MDTAAAARLRARADLRDAAVGEEEQAGVYYGAQAGCDGEKEGGCLPGVAGRYYEVVEDCEKANDTGQGAWLVDCVGLEEWVADGECEEGGEREACCEDGEAEYSDRCLIYSESVYFHVGCREHKEASQDHSRRRGGRQPPVPVHCISVRL
jgi:hypothetical protein